MVGLPEIKQKIQRCQGRDRHRLRRRLQRLGDEPDARAALESAIDASIERRERCLETPLLLAFPPDLPVVARRGEIGAAIAQHPVVIVCGETGSGKTTQIPKICLSLGRGVDGLIGHTQPRRLAARAVAGRIAEELQSELGDVVGFQTRFNKQLGENNRIKLMTDGILLAEIQRDRWLNQYDTLIIDEAHERSLNIDFLLGYLKQLVGRRPELKLIITSATLDVARIAAHFDAAPVIDVEGRAYPVEVRYRSLEQDGGDADDRDVNRAIDQAIDELQEAGRGDVLVFLPGEREIRDASKALKHRRERFEIHPLYARLGPGEQQRIFQRGTKPRIILATNVAETSLTVPGIRYVIDTGTARISRYSWKAQIQRLPIERISQASAAQRAGRCGRTGPGVCIRLYSEEDFAAREPFTQPEIQRTNLAAVILQMANLKLGAVDAFPFIDAPDTRLVRDGYRLLQELQAVDANRRLTPTGRELARLPIDPRLARMVLAAASEGALREILIIVTALAVGDPRERPFDRQQAADEKHARFRDKRSDFAGLLSLWRYLDEQGEASSQSALRRLCRDEFISFRRLREWRDLQRQLALATKAAGLAQNTTAADYDAIHRSLLAGLLDHVGFRQERGAYTGSRNRRFFPFPGSDLHAKPPKWVIAAEITETSRVYARTIAGIDPQWVEQIGGHLLKRRYSEPHWQRRKARVGGYEKVLLNGLVINPQRLIDYARIDPEGARVLFIRHALVLGEWDRALPVVAQNRALVAEIEDLEARIRRRDLLVSEDELFAFYDARIPAHVNSGAGFAKWVKDLDDIGELQLDHAQLLRTTAPEIAPDAFPDRWRHGRIELPLSYRFTPGASDDGVTLSVPLALLGQIDERRTHWLVPGLLEEKIVALLRALPKQTRKHFIPVPDFARAATEALVPYRGDLYTELSAVLQRMTGREVPLSLWNAPADDHLCLRIVVRGVDGEIVASGRDLGLLRESLQETVAALPPSPAASAFEREVIDGWDFGDLPKSLEIEEDGYTIERYPGLAERGDSVALCLFDDPDTAQGATRGGVARLLAQELRTEQRYLAKNLPDLQRLCLLFAPIAAAGVLRMDLFVTATERCFLDETPLPRNRAAFDALLRERRDAYVAVASALAQQLGAVLSAYGEVRARLNRELPLSWIEAARDIESQIAALVYPGFLRATPAIWLEQMPRYFAAIMRRLDTLDREPDRDRLRRSEIEPLCERLRAVSPADVGDPARLLQYKWLLEELRVSMFAQELGTREKVSVKRLDTLWRRLDA
jgi:ATP-dependent helicase HrpA